MTSWQGSVALLSSSVLLLSQARGGGGRGREQRLAGKNWLNLRGSEPSLRKREVLSRQREQLISHSPVEELFMSKSSWRERKSRSFPES